MCIVCVQYSVRCNATLINFCNLEIKSYLVEIAR